MFEAIVVFLCLVFTTLFQLYTFCVALPTLGLLEQGDNAKLKPTAVANVTPTGLIETTSYTTSISRCFLTIRCFRFLHSTPSGLTLFIAL